MAAVANRARILVVDDQLREVNAVQHALADEFEILCAPEGQRGLELAASEPDLAVVMASAHMLTDSGHSLLAKLRDTSKATRVLLSDCREPEQLVSALNHGGVFAFARKPWSFDELRSTLRGAVAQHAKHRECEQLHRQLKDLAMVAHYDELTHLPKRGLLSDRLNERLAAAHSGKQLAVVLIDIDRFRRINVSLGRDAGDMLIFAIVARLRPLLGPDDTLARLDGNTFAWLIADARDPGQVAARLERDVLPRLRAPYRLEEIELRVCCRIGVAVGPTDGERAELLIRHAEAALNKAQVANQPYVFYAPIMNDRVAERLALENRLRRAIENEEFVLHYQPKLELKSGQIVGLEALIRWNDPQQGMISPAHFIPVLEETGLIVDVGRWVFREAAQQFVRWRDQGRHPPPIAVNVSSLELGQTDFLPAIEQARSDHPRAEDGVELEITESVLMDDFQSNIDKLRSVRERGLHVAIDDFGTGYSSLGYLSRLPIDALKVDRSFVTRMTEDPQDMTIVMMIISLAHALDLKVIAEGPETVQQAQLLRLLKCDQIQGYIVAKPQPGAQVSELLGKTMSFAPPSASAAS